MTGKLWTFGGALEPEELGARRVVPWPGAERRDTITAIWPGVRPRSPCVSSETAAETCAAPSTRAGGARVEPVSETVSLRLGRATGESALLAAPSRAGS